MKTCYLIGASDFHEKIEKCEKDLIIAADGGYDGLIQHGYAPDLLIGDLDSLKTSLPDGLEIIKFPREKNETDMFLAYLEGVRRGYTNFVILGALGGKRFEHSIANIALLEYAEEHGHSAFVRSESCEIFCIKNREVKLTGNSGNYFSLFAQGGDAIGVCVKGAKYEAEDEKLTTSFPLGISNEFTDGECSVSVADGKLLIVISK